jgi:hypothetical protein
VVIDASSQLPPSVAEYYNSENSARPNKQFWGVVKIVIEAIGVCAAIAAGIFTYWTLQQVIKQAQAAESQAISARTSMVVSQKAFVFFSMALTRHPITDKSGKATAWEFLVPIQNIGNTPTKDLSIIGRIFLDGRFGEAPVPYYDDLTVKEGPRLFLPPHAIGNQTTPVGVNTMRIKEINKKPIYFYGWAKYHDVFDISDRTPLHITMYCFQVSSYAGDPTVPDISFNPAFAPCPGRHNCADEECDGEPYSGGQIWHAAK